MKFGSRRRFVGIHGIGGMDGNIAGRAIGIVRLKTARCLRRQRQKEFVTITLNVKGAKGECALYPTTFHISSAEAKADQFQQHPKMGR